MDIVTQLRSCLLDRDNFPRMSSEKWLPVKLASAAADEIERLKTEIQEWHDCAQYDAMMTGPRFKGWNRSSLDRCRKRFIDHV